MHSRTCYKTLAKVIFRRNFTKIANPQPYHQRTSNYWHMSQDEKNSYLLSLKNIPQTSNPVYLLPPPCGKYSEIESKNFAATVQAIFELLKANKNQDSPLINQLFKSLTPYLEIEIMHPYMTPLLGYKLTRIISFYGDITGKMIFYLRDYFIKNSENLTFTLLVLGLHGINMAFLQTETTFQLKLEEINKIVQVAENLLNFEKTDDKIVSIFLTLLSEQRIDSVILHEKILPIVLKINRDQLYFQLLASLARNRISIKNEEQMCMFLDSLKSCFERSKKLNFYANILLNLIILKEFVYQNSSKVHQNLVQHEHFFAEILKKEHKSNQFTIKTNFLMFDAYYRGLAEMEQKGLHSDRNSRLWFDESERQVWKTKMKKNGIESTSHKQNSLAKIFESKGIEFECEYFLEYKPIDFWFPKKKIGIEALGIVHYLSLSQQIDGKTALKLLIFERMGHKILPLKTVSKDDFFNLPLKELELIE